MPLTMVLMQDMQAEKLKEQLRNTIMERKREAKKAFDMAGAWSKGAASRPAGRLAKKGDEATINVRLAAGWQSKPDALHRESFDTTTVCASPCDVYTDRESCTSHYKHSRYFFALCVSLCTSWLQIRAWLCFFVPACMTAVRSSTKSQISGNTHFLFLSSQLNLMVLFDWFPSDSYEAYAE